MEGPGRRFSAASPAGGPLPPLLVAPDPDAAQPPQPLPKPEGSPPYRLDLEEVLGAEAVGRVRKAGRITFHVTGDTGGVASPQAQHLVAAKMAADPEASFLYLLGDVVYFYGQGADYFAQFYDAYVDYRRPIFAIPGNHDGDVLPGHPASLSAFTDNFCSRRPHLTSEAGDSGRDSMNQPNVFWTLRAPFVTIIGLYTNVPEGGWLGPEQTSWLESELAAAPAGAALVLALHHPVFSWDRFHHGSQYLLDVLDAAAASSGRKPDLVLSGHVHNYQRFARTGDSSSFVVAGAGGYWRLHQLPSVDGHPPQLPFAPPGVAARLEAFCDDRHGFLRLSATPSTLDLSYLVVPRPHEKWSAPAAIVDRLSIPIRTARATAAQRT
jgi:Calcineurin-like phosphoesterase